MSFNIPFAVFQVHGLSLAQNSVMFLMLTTPTGRLALRNDPRNPWTGRNMLESFIQLNNRVFARFSAEERKNIGVHTCPGGDCDSVHSLDVDYSALYVIFFALTQ